MIVVSFSFTKSLFPHISIILVSIIYFYNFLVLNIHYSCTEYMVIT